MTTPTPADTVRTLQNALDHLRGRGWARGRMTQPDGAVCAAGAIRAVTPNRPDLQGSPEERAAITALAQHVTPPPPGEDCDAEYAALPGCQVTAWNDACTTQEQVEAGFQRAITHLRSNVEETV